MPRLGLSKSKKTLLANTSEEAYVEFVVRGSRRRLSWEEGFQWPSLVCFLALSPIDPSCNRGNAISVVSKNVALRKEVEVAVGWVGGVSSVKMVWEGRGGNKLRCWFLGRTRHLSSATTHWADPGFEPRRVSSGISLSQPNSRVSRTKATRQGWRSCLVLIGAK